MPIVYKHTNRISKKAYIGWSTLTMMERWEKHLINANVGINTCFYNAIRKYGIDSWDHEVLEEHVDADSAKLAEIRLIHEHNTYAFNVPSCGYNMTHGGDGISGDLVVQSNERRIITVQSRLKMSFSRRKRKTSQTTKNLISAFQKGKSYTKSHALNHKLAQERRSVRSQNLRIALEEQKVLLCGGPDRCGKTNILKEVERRTGIPYFKARSEHTNFLSDQNQFLNELRFADPRVADVLYQTGWSMLIDRGFMCEWVYAQFFNRSTDVKMLRKMDIEYSKIGAKVLICTRKSFAGIKDDLDPKIDERALQKLSDLYMEFVKWTKCKTYVLYVDDEDLEREMREVLAFIKGL